MVSTRSISNLGKSVLLSMAVACVTTFALSTHENAQATSELSRSRINWRTAVSATPSDGVNDADRSLRYERSAAFDDTTGSKQPLDSADQQEVHKGQGMDVYYTKTDPLPSSISDLVLLGRVVSFQPYFSNDKTAIYTELHVQVEKIFKDNPGVVHGEIAIDLLGGAIRLRNGRIARQVPAPADSDIEIGNRYVLFLNYIEKTQSFRVVKGWLLTGGRAQSLAKTDIKDVQTGKSKHHGMFEDEFLDEVQKSVSTTSN